MKVSGYCAALLDWNGERGDLASSMGEEWSGKARRNRQRCEGNVLAECLADFERSHPNENVENRLVLQIKDFFQVGFSRTLLWGGTVGFRQACQEAGTMVIGECVSEQVSCERKADPTNICMQSEENRP